MSDVLLGTRPQTMTLLLTEGGDFNCTLVSQDGDWPGTAVITLVVGASTWTATLAGSEATFAVDKAAVQTVIDAGTKRFRLVCTDGTADLPWGQGNVAVTRNV